MRSSYPDPDKLVVSKRKTLLIKKYFKLHCCPGARGSDNFSSYHDGLLGLGKFERHGDFLPDGQWIGGFNKNSGSTDVLNRCIEIRIGSFAADDDGLVFLE